MSDASILPPLPYSPWTFFARVLGWLLLTSTIWMQVSAWTSYPVAGIAHVVLGNGARDWVRRIHQQPGLIQVETRIAVATPPGMQGEGRAELVAEANPSRHAYGLPLLLALLLASRRRHLLLAAIGGYLLLLVPQTFSLSLELLRQMMVAADSPASLGIAQWQMEGIALGYQAGSLLLPTLAPIMIWLWLDREFFLRLCLPSHRHPLPAR